MKETIPFLSIVGALLALIVLSGGVLIWLAPVTKELLTSSQEILLSTADWMIKSSAGAIFGIAVGRRVVAVKTNGAASG